MPRLRMPHATSYFSLEIKSDPSDSLKMAVAAFFFQVQLLDKLAKGRANNPHRYPDVYIEVPPSALAGPRERSSAAEKAEHDIALAIAEKLSTRLIGEKFPGHGPLDFLVAQIGRLPSIVSESAPTAQQGGARAWLVLSGDRSQESGDRREESGQGTSSY